MFIGYYVHFPNFIISLDVDIRDSLIQIKRASSGHLLILRTVFISSRANNRVYPCNSTRTTNAGNNGQDRRFCMAKVLFSQDVSP